MADGGVNGDGAARPIQLLEVTVTADDIAWSYTKRWPGDETTGGQERLARTAERCATIDLLVALLHHHSDLEREDRISTSLYKQLLRVVGQQLFGLLFVGRLKRQLAETLDDVTEHGHLLRVKLRFDGSDEHIGWLAGLPWEYVHTPAGDRDLDAFFLSRHAELMLSRRLPARKNRPLGDPRPLTVLLVSPNPRLVDPDDVDSERLYPVDARTVTEKLTELHRAGTIRLRTLVDPPPGPPAPDIEWTTISALRQRVRESPGPVIVHFLGHGRRKGQSGQLLFSRSDGSRHWVDTATFSDHVRRSSVKLVFLQACDSNLPDPYVPLSSVAMGVALSGVPAVVAMQYRIKAELANEFTRAFYDELLVSNSAIDVAVEAGRERIEDRIDERDALAFGLPVVYLTSHNGMLSLDLTASEEAVDRNDTEGRSTCPRCGRSPLRPDAKRCPRCKLQLRCEVCAGNPPLGDPLEDQLCEVCDAEVHQPEWNPDRSRVETAPATEVLTVFEQRRRGLVDE
jgi:hypothetical protein